MKLIVSGFIHMQGVSQKTNRAYNFSQLLVLQQMQPTSNENFTRNCAGYEQAQLDADEHVGQQVSELKLPGTYEVETRQEVRGGKIINIVSGVK